MCDVVRLVRDPRDACCRGDGRSSSSTSLRSSSILKRLVGTGISSCQRILKHLSARGTHQPFG
jgi:hypothetical protein